MGATLRSGSDGKSVTELHNVGAITLALLDDEAHANLDKKRSGSDEDTGCESDERGIFWSGRAGVAQGGWVRPTPPTHLTPPAADTPTPRYRAFGA